jgi:hypothetical protein
LPVVAEFPTVAADFLASAFETVSVVFGFEPNIVLGSFWCYPDSGRNGSAAAAVVAEAQEAHLEFDSGIPDAAAVAEPFLASREQEVDSERTEYFDLAPLSSVVLGIGTAAAADSVAETPFETD